MYIRIVLLKLVFSLMVLMLSSIVLSPAVVSAEEVSISNNGNGSSNTSSAFDSQTTQSNSANETDTENAVDTSLTTGSNENSENIGGVTITTGDATSQTTLQNEANTAAVESPSCCSTKGVLSIISGNGSASKNGTVSNTTNANSVTTTQNSSITNAVLGTSSTGNNTANGNTGKVIITTGKILVKQTVKNGPLNMVEIDPLTGKPLHSMIGILDNGSSSTNLANHTTTTTSTLSSVHTTNVTNALSLTLSTGNNTANGNTGDVSIRTGDVDVLVLIENGPLQVSKVSVDCDCEPDKPTEVPLTPAPDKITPPTVSDKTSSGGTGEVASIVASRVLPVTGMNWLIVAFFGNVMMLLLGMILRLRSGNSPGIAQ